MSKYEVDSLSLRDHMTELQSGEKELKVKLKDTEDQSWVTARVVASKQPVEEGEQMSIMSTFGLPAGDIYIKITD